MLRVKINLLCPIIKNAYRDTSLILPPCILLLIIGPIKHPFTAIGKINYMAWPHKISLSTSWHVVLYRETRRCHTCNTLCPLMVFGQGTSLPALKQPFKDCIVPIGISNFSITSFFMIFSFLLRTHGAIGRFPPSSIQICGMQLTFLKFWQRTIVSHSSFIWSHITWLGFLNICIRSRRWLMSKSCQ